MALQSIDSLVDKQVTESHLDEFLEWKEKVLKYFGFVVNRFYSNNILVDRIIKAEKNRAKRTKKAMESARKMGAPNFDWAMSPEGKEASAQVDYIESFFSFVRKIQYESSRIEDKIEIYREYGLGENMKKHIKIGIPLTFLVGVIIPLLIISPLSDLIPANWFESIPSGSIEIILISMFSGLFYYTVRPLLREFDLDPIRPRKTIQAWKEKIF